MTPESSVKADVKRRLNNYKNVTYVMPVTGGYGRGGYHDYIVCVAGKFLTIECKSDRGKTTALQDAFANQVAEAGGTCLCVTGLDECEYVDVYVLMLGGIRK